MPLYEHVFLARPDISGQQVDTLVDTYKGVLTENGGSVSKTEYWGLKSLPYRIKKNRKAHYTLLNIDAPPAALAEMERQMRISDDVLRFMTIKVAELEEGPSAMMRRDQRDDRRGGSRFRDREGGGGGGDRGDRSDRGGDRGERTRRPPREDDSTSSRSGEAAGKE